MKIKFTYRFEDREGTVVGIKTLSTGNLAILVCEDAGSDRDDEAVKSFLVNRMTNVSTVTEVTEPLETRLAALEARLGDDNFSGPATKEEVARVTASVQWFQGVAHRLGQRVSKLEARTGIKAGNTP